MKKIYLLAATLFSFMSFGQVILNEDFNYTAGGNIGGNTTTTTDAVGSNNWFTHSNTSGNSGTIDVLSGNLNYTGLQASNGNKIFLPGSNSTVPRDVNRPITTSSTTVYCSFLLNVVDNTQLAATISGNNNYFFAFGQTSGGVGITVLAARLGITSSNSGTNYRLHISNNSGGTPTYTENAVDLNFGQSYLVVIKLDRAASPVAATLWVNPTTLGSTEPAGSVSNNSGTGTITSFASITLRNAANTPKAEIDEFRVGNTFADVTPVNLSTKDFNNISGLKMYPNPAKNVLNIASDSFAPKNVEIYTMLGKKVLASEVVNGSVNISALAKGIYVVKIKEEDKTATRELVVE